MVGHEPQQHQSSLLGVTSGGRPRGTTLLQTNIEVERGPVLGLLSSIVRPSMGFHVNPGTSIGTVWDYPAPMLLEVCLTKDGYNHTMIQSLDQGSLP